MMISETDARMLKLLNDVLHNRQPDPVSPEDWPDLFNELCLQTVYALPGEYVFSLGLSTADTQNYLANLLNNRRTFHHLMKIQSKVIDVLNNAQIPFVILKGGAAAMNYPCPENRCMGDIDLLVAPGDAAPACAALLDTDGFRLSENPKPLDRHYRLFTDDKIRIELHMMFASSDNPNQNEILDRALYQAIPSRIFTEVCGYSFPVLPPLENGLVLLSHINHHMANGIGLRQIIDWMLFVEKYLDDDFWNHGFSEMAEQIGMKDLAILVTGMCRKYLGLQKDIHWSSYEPVCDDLLTYILDSGNFGKSPVTLKSRIVEVLKNFKNPLKGLSMAQSYGLAHWDAAKKHRILRPFAWCYQFGHWTRAGLNNGADSKTLTDAAIRAKRETNLFLKLGITRSRK